MCFCFFQIPVINAQIKLYQLSGIVSDAASSFPLAYTAVNIDGTYRATWANEKGFFSIPVAAGEKIIFTHVGFEPKSFIVPDTFSTDIVSIGVFMHEDTIELTTVEIYPWPDVHEFHDAFVGLQLAEEKYEIEFFGIKGKEQIDTVPPEPTIFQPISLFYEEIIKPIEYKRKKKNKAKELPKWE